MIKISTKQACRIAFILSFIGIATELITIVIPYGIEFVRRLQYILRTTSLNFGSLLSYRDFDSGMTLEYVNLILHVTLLLSAVFYKWSHGRETRLIRFSFATLMVASGIHAFTTLITAFKYSVANESGYGIFIIAMFIVSALVCALSYFSLIAFSETKVLDVKMVYSPGKEPKEDFVNTSNARRLLHLIFDTYFCFLLMLPLINIFGGFLDILYRLLGDERLILLVVTILGRMIYYPFFEFIFGATPAKFLSESRVIDANTGRRPSLSTLLIRTISRFIPFEPFSFLANANWHDRISNTRVVDEKRTGVKTSKYWWLILAYLVVGVGIYIGKEVWKEFSYQRNSDRYFSEKVKTMEDKIDHLNTNDLIKTEYDSDGTLFLKIEEIKTKSVIATAFWLKDTYRYSDNDLEKYYENSKGYLPQLEVSKDSLLAAINKKRNNYRFKGAHILDDEKSYVIETFIQIGSPGLKVNSTGGIHDNTIYFSIENTGWPVDVISIQNVEGNTEWQGELPARLSSKKTFPITGNNYQRGQLYKFEITVKDTLDRQYRYLIEGRNFDRTITQLE